MTDLVENHLDQQIDPAEGRVSWRDHLPVHPAADLFPPMSESELWELGEDIRANGLQQPIVVFCEDWKRGDAFKLLDGRNRLDAMELVGIDFKIRRRRHRGDRILYLEFSQEDHAVGRLLSEGRRSSIEIFAGMDEADLQAFVASANLHRRHLNVEQRQELLITLIARQPERSDRQIAKMAGVDHKTIAAARAKGEEVGSIPHVETRTDSRGRKQPARKTKTTKPKPIDRRVTGSSEISLEKRRAENAELDLTAEERAAKASPDRRNHGGAVRHQSPLELENSESGDDEELEEVADAATVEDSALYSLERMCEYARMFKRFFKLSSFDREAEVRISTAIDSMIQKWRSTQARLTKNVQSDIVEQCLSLIMAMNKKQRAQFFAKYTELSAARAPAPPSARLPVVETRSAT
jgi:ParB-like chromosome segregation protein Spo0J